MSETIEQPARTTLMQPPGSDFKSWMESRIARFATTGPDRPAG